MKQEDQMNTEDLVGQKFGRLTVVERDKDRIDKRGRHMPMWICKCECGTMKTVYAYNLKNGTTTSCGCIRTEDLTGQKFGKLTVIKLDKDRVNSNGQRSTRWICKCECGTIKTVAASKLKNGSTKSCGCLNKDKVEDLTGQRFGKLTVIKRAETSVDKSGRRNTTWLCKCDCGNEKVVRASQLKKGKTKSCGCASRVDLIGQKFGQLTVIARGETKVSKSGKKSTMWLCRCECGNEKLFSTNRLHDKRIKSCGNCKQISLLGTTCISKCGLKATVTNYAGSKRVEVTLEDGSILNVEPNKVKDGGPLYPKEMSNYLKAKNYHGYKDLSFAFRLEDGSVYFYCFTPDDEWDVLTLQDMYKKDTEVKKWRDK